MEPFFWLDPSRRSEFVGTIPSDEFGVEERMSCIEFYRPKDRRLVARIVFGVDPEDDGISMLETNLGNVFFRLMFGIAIEKRIWGYLEKFGAIPVSEILKEDGQQNKECRNGGVGDG